MALSADINHRESGHILIILSDFLICKPVRGLTLTVPLRKKSRGV